MSTTTTITTFPTTQGDLPAFVFPADHELPLVETVEVGQIVAFHSRGRYRAAKVTKVGPKRIEAVYTTQGARTDAEKIADIDHVARVKAGRVHELKSAARNLRCAELIEAGRVEVTEHRTGPEMFASSVKIATLDPEWQQLEAQRGSSNAAKTTMVFEASKYRKWAETKTEAEYERALAEAEAKNAVPREERIREATHVTTKSVKRGEVFAVETA